MTKRISVWLMIAIVIATTTVTFMLTVLYGGYFVSAEETVSSVLQETADAEAEKAKEKEEVSPEEITERLTRKIRELMMYYNAYFVGELDVDALVQGVAEGLVAYSGDKYGSYHTKEELSEILTGYDGAFAGIGVTVVYNEEYAGVEILSVFENSPAEEAGLLPNDLIVAVEGVSVAYLGYNDAIDSIRGEIGTPVTVTVARGEGYTQAFNVTLVRQEVEEQSVIYENITSDALRNPIGYIRVTTFNEKTPEQFKEALGDGISEDVHGFIIDMRNNGGGTLNSVLSMLDMILPEGPIVRIQYKNGEETVYESSAGSLSTRLPIIVLVNGNTASAAELFTASLHDYGRAIVIGETTYGKGTVQSIIQLSDGAGLRISTSLYAPPFSDNFEGVGITPDIVVPIAEEYKYVNLYKLELENDAQLQAAINLYK